MASPACMGRARPSTRAWEASCALVEDAMHEADTPEPVVDVVVYMPRDQSLAKGYEVRLFNIEMLP